MFGFASRFGPDANRSYNPSGDGNASSADNLADGEYMTFAISADVGKTLNLSNIGYRASRNGGSGRPDSLDLYVKVDGGSFAKVGDTAGVGDTSNPEVINRALTDPGFQGVQSAEFAFVFFNGNNTGIRAYLDNIVLTGSVVPEPASLVLLGLGGLCMLGSRRG